MGTRFAATAESLAPPAYKELLVSQQMADSITTDRISGMSATFLRGSIEGAGLDPDNLPPRAGLLKPTLDPSIQAWRDIWSGGHGVGLIDDIPMTAALVDRLEGEYLAAARRSERLKHRVERRRVRCPGRDHRLDVLAMFTEGKRGHLDRKSVVSGKRVSVRLDLGCRRIIKKNKNYTPKR